MTPSATFSGHVTAKIALQQFINTSLHVFGGAQVQLFTVLTGLQEFFLLGAVDYKGSPDGTQTKALKHLR